MSYLQDIQTGMIINDLRRNAFRKEFTIYANLSNKGQRMPSFACCDCIYNSCISRHKGLCKAYTSRVQ